MQQGHRVVRAVGLGAGLLAAVGALTACTGIDKSQWSARWQPTPGTSTSTSGTSTSTSTSTSSTSRTATAAAAAADNGPGNDRGVTPGAPAGTRRSTAATVTLAAPAQVCWVLVVDATASQGCGRAVLTDVRGTAAARATKVGGVGTITLTLTAAGRTVDTGSVSGSGRFVTVLGPV